MWAGRDWRGLALMIMKKATKQADSKPAAVKAAAMLDAKAQTELFGNAMKRFSKGEYAEAAIQPGWRRTAAGGL